MSLGSENLGFPLGRPARLAVLLSGRGSNFAALHRSCEEGLVEGRVVGVISDNPEAGGISIANGAGISSHVVDRKMHATRDSHEQQVLKTLTSLKPDLICLAGYMRLLSENFIQAFSGRVLNIHPSLLPSFPGLHAQRKALEHGVKLAGCTVHFVDAGLDSGPIVVQSSVPVRDDDDELSLSDRILEKEHQDYPRAVRLILNGAWKIEGRHFKSF